MEPTEIVRDGVRLRLFAEPDADDVTSACDDPLTRRFVPDMPSPYTRADALRWITEQSVAAWRAGGAAWAIADPATDRLLGCVGLTRMVPEREQIEVGYWVGPWARGHGVATAATIAATRQALASGFRRVELLTEWTNPASQRVALTAGFRWEGVRRGARDGGAHRPADGGSTRDDLIVWARLLGDPPGPTPRTLPDLPGGSLTDGVVTLRPVGPDDTDFLYRLRTDAQVVAASVPPVPPSPTAVEGHCARARGEWLAGQRAALVILNAVSGSAAGEIALYYQEPETGQAMIGYAVLPAWRGNGYAGRAARLLAGWAFDTAGISRLIAGTSPNNIGSQRALEKAGFVREGYLRARLPGVGANRIDDVLFALLPTDLAG